jgi:hypothetical protein
VPDILAVAVHNPPVRFNYKLPTHCVVLFAINQDTVGRLETPGGNLYNLDTEGLHSLQLER